jgi:hypothetical protein
MSRSNFRLPIFAVIAGACISICSLAAAVESAPAVNSAVKKPVKELPKWDQVERAANATLRSAAGYQPGDIIARSEAQACFARLAALGWEIADAQALAAAVPGDDEFIVRHLRGKNNKDGHRFMSHVAKYPEGYDRLDRMIHMPRGETITEDLIHNPGGYQMVEYLATAEGGTEMGKMLSEIPKGKNFNQPTGRIYTAEQLIARLKQSYDGAAKELKNGPSKKGTGNSR